MNELFKALKNFIVRDIIYIIGGASVTISFLYLFKKLDTIGKETPTATYLFIAGIGYVIGYCIQDTASWIRIVTTASYFQPWPILTSLYFRFEHRAWKDIFPDIREENQEKRRKEIFKRLDKAELLIQEKESQGSIGNRERLT